jgi:hypothetical protein
MGRLLDLLQAAAGEGSLRSKLGHWRQEVSAALDSLVSGSSAAASEFLQAALGNPQVGVTTGTNVVPDLVINTSGDIGYDPATGIVTLVAGRTYRLQAIFRAINFSDAVTGALSISWVDADDNAVVSARSPATFFPMTGTGSVSSNPTSDVIFTPAAGRETVRLRVTVASGTADLSVAVATVTRLR